MKLVFALLLFSCTISAQNTGAVLVFSVTDTNNFDQNHLLSEISASPVINSSLNKEISFDIKFHEDDNYFSLFIPQAYTGNIIQIQIQKQVGNMVELMNLYYKSAKKDDPTNGCNACLCSNIIFAPGNFIFDMPMQAASWPLLPDAEKMIGGEKIVLKDISMLQNWREQKIK